MSRERNVHSRRGQLRASRSLPRCVALAAPSFPFPVRYPPLAFALATPRRRSLRATTTQMAAQRISSTSAAALAVAVASSSVFASASSATQQHPPLQQSGNLRRMRCWVRAASKAAREVAVLRLSITHPRRRLCRCHLFRSTVCHRHAHLVGRLAWARGSLYLESPPPCSSSHSPGTSDGPAAAIVPPQKVRIRPPPSNTAPDLPFHTCTD